MNRYFHIPLLIVLFLLHGCDQLESLNGGVPGDKAPSPSPEGDIIAIVNGVNITQPMLDMYMRQRQEDEKTAGETESQSLNNLINLELMRQEGVRKGFETDPGIIALIDQQQRTIIASAAMTDYLKTNPITEEQVQDAYDAEIAEPATEYSARHILVKTKPEAEQIIAMLDIGSDFAELAREKSIGPSAKNGGDLGWFRAAQMAKPFADATAELEPGSYTAEPVETQFGWHVIWLQKSREIPPPPFDKIKDQVRKALANRLLQDHIKQVREAATVEIAGQTPAE